MKFDLEGNFLNKFGKKGEGPGDMDTPTDLIVAKKLKIYPQLKTVTKLKFKFSFPSEDLEQDDIFLWGPDRIAINEKGEVFITDNDWKHIFKFDTKGN